MGAVCCEKMGALAVHNSAPHEMSDKHVAVDRSIDVGERRVGRFRPTSPTTEPKLPERRVWIDNLCERDRVDVNLSSARNATRAEILFANDHVAGGLNSIVADSRAPHRRSVKVSAHIAKRYLVTKALNLGVL